MPRVRVRPKSAVVTFPGQAASAFLKSSDSTPVWPAFRAALPVQLVGEVVSSVPFSGVAVSGHLLASKVWPWPGKAES